ncbi:hypothetical protein [Nocardioides alcanivorans]|uniref:hypothetical protein n=1 Tax=Nocardioides alcanivorans TaxID=2897352 RepID=UPI001F239153|nr:hypothetical protein [Nocardioides alcanivorans]
MGAEHNILVHVVPPPVHHIVITPANSTIVAGDTQAYTAQSYDEDDQLLGDVTATTTFTGSGQVTCTENVCGSDTAGDETITATRGALTAAAQLTIVAGDARRLQVTPGSATVVAGETRSFTARTYDLHDNLVADVTDSTTFTADGAASCSDNRCGSNSVGSYTVTGTHAGMDDTAVLTVSAAAVHTLLIAPELMTVQAGGSQEYAAHVYDRFDNYVSEVTGATQFTGTGATTCSANVCSSETAGNVTITGTWSGLEATAQLTVVPAAPARIALTPGTTTVPAGDVQTYSVEAFDAYDNLIEEVSPSSALAGSGAATCDADRCGSTTAGDYTITATWNGLTDTATLTVTAAEAHRLDITPDTSTITAGDSLTYTARTFDRFDNLVADVTTDTVFTPSTDDVTCTAATCGSEKAGTYSITGTLHDLDLADVAELTVTAASLHHLRVTPETATVTAGETHDFTAHSYDQYDNLIANVTNDTVFTPDTDDVTCTAATCGSEKAGNYTITGTHLDVTDSASLTVTAAEPQRLEITPENVSIAAGETHDFTADAYDQYDNHVADVTNDTTFTPDSDDVTCTAATCGSEKAGNYTISAVYDEDLGASILARLVAPRAVAATASLQVVAGPLDHLDLTPPRASISTDQRQTYQLDGYDSYGNTHGDLTDAAAFTIDGRGTCDGAACGSAVAGRYDVVATIDDLSATAELEVTSDDAGTPVGPPATDPPSVTALPATGTDMQWWQFPAGLLFAGAGLAMLWLNRRQRFAQ